MSELVKHIITSISVFLADLNKNVEQGNKAAGVRARKESIELEKLLKQYRKESVK